jgi:PGF-pre-PGF domain-containing protein
MRYIFLFCLIAIFLAGTVSANFVCGEVGNSKENMSSSWFSVHVFYPGDEGNFAMCQISPDGNKYCCDSEAIPNHIWKMGDVLDAEIYDNVTGYFAGPVSVVTTGKGYDVFPKMILTKAINIYQPDKKLFISDESKFFLNASFSSPYTDVSIDKNNGLESLCTDCNSFSSEVDCSFGMNYYKVWSYSGSKWFGEDLVFAVLSSVDMNRVLTCQGCRNTLIRADRNIEVSVDVNLSDAVSGMKLMELVPVEFEILDAGGGEVSEYSPTHNAIVWDVSGKDINENYVVHSPSVLLLPKQYSFKTYLEDEVLSEKNYIVYRWFSFFSSQNQLVTKQVLSGVYSNIALNNPLIVNPENEDVTRVVIYPKKEISNVLASLKIYSPAKNLVLKDSMYEKVNYYFIDSNFDFKNVAKSYVEFKVSRDYFSKNKLGGMKFFSLDKIWKEESVVKYKEDRNYLYYRANMNSENKFAVVYVKQKRSFFWWLGF